MDDIEFILKAADFKVTKAIENKMMKPALRMHIMRIAEQFHKMKEENAFEVLEKFDPADLRGLSAVRNFIAHDYDSVDEGIIEDVIRLNLPKLRSDVQRCLDAAGITRER